ncbi:hypothetical protein SMACR_04101 [Sordaria macrospora]|uniref:Uncharacterized protein n=1 Tax=Sordaria macrospora TaxID=5147 RepID=A0A8S8ZH13_SORMA|nr:hypothetical protein SMACR_04101 [Sordaria macrospora]WPJ64383.1 hypothetical protein SMAC4_04101 [Sordaria macrospora]
MALEVTAKGMGSSSGGDEECGCYMEAIEIRRGESPTAEAKQCLQSCRDQFLETVSIEHETSEGWKYICKDLTSKTPSSRFWSLYWCDTTFCGVWINQTGGLQQDPNVDLIINSCQDIGFHSVLDPGPPPKDFVCQTNEGGAGLCSPTGVKINPMSTPSPPVIQEPISIPSTSGSATPLSSPALSSAATTPSLSTSTATLTTTDDATLITDPSWLSATPARPTVAESFGLNNGTTTSKGGLPMGVNAAISVCSVTGFIVMVALAFLCLQRHKKHRSGLDDVRGRSRSRLDNGIAPRGSPTPLIASSHDSRPLIPPLRLRDRKLLPSILRSGHNQSPSPPLTPLTPAHSHGGGGGGGHSSVMFPSSPITSPTTNKLVPRYERTPRVHGTTGSLPSLPPPALFGIHGSGAPRSRGSLSSYGAGSTTGPSSLRNEAFSFSGTTSPPPTSPTRPPRPHEGPLEIPDLVKPAPFPFGSRMNRSVPSASPQPVSPLSHTSSLAMGGSSASPMWNPARAVSSPRDERASGDHHVVGEYSGQDRGSWGSWSDNGYGDSYGNGNGNGSGRKVASAIVGNSGHATGALSPVRGARSISTCAVSPPPRLPLRPMAISTMSSAVSSSGPIGFAVTGGPGRTSNSAAVSTLHEEDGGLF